MSIRVVRAIFVAPVLLAALAGCVYRSKEVERSTPNPVVMAPTPAPAPATVVVPPATTVAPAVPSDRVVYPDGRWQLYGDGRGTPYYWVWIPSGVHDAAGPAHAAAGRISSAARRTDPPISTRGGFSAPSRFFSPFASRSLPAGWLV